MLVSLFLYALYLLLLSEVGFFRILYKACSFLYMHLLCFL